MFANTSSGNVGHCFNTFSSGPPNSRVARNGITSAGVFGTLDRMMPKVDASSLRVFSKSEELNGADIDAGDVEEGAIEEDVED